MPDLIPEEYVDESMSKASGPAALTQQLKANNFYVPGKLQDRLRMGENHGGRGDIYVPPKTQFNERRRKINAKIENFVICFLRT